MLLSFVILYLTLSIGIGLFAATRVHNTKDFAVAGRSLPLPVVTATVFATWFGAGLVANEPLPRGETSARTKQTTAAGLLIMLSVGWDLAAPPRSSESNGQ